MVGNTPLPFFFAKNCIAQDHPVSPVADAQIQYLGRIDSKIGLQVPVTDLVDLLSTTGVVFFILSAVSPGFCAESPRGLDLSEFEALVCTL